MSAKLKAPFPWFGGKSRVADLVWSRFGEVNCYLDPFCGSLAVLLAREINPRRVETVNDADGFLVNFWRATQHAPEDVARHLDWPVTELDLSARNRWLTGVKPEFSERMRRDPFFFDAKIAGWWAWGVSSAIGGASSFASEEARRHFGAMPQLRCYGGGVHGKTFDPVLLTRLQERLRGVRVLCGDWGRLVRSQTTLYPHDERTLAGVLLDPPYDAGCVAYADMKDRSKAKGEVARASAEWARDNGSNPRLRIALCGYEGDHDLPGWECVAWRTGGGYANRNGADRNANAGRERIWFSPHCLRPQAEPPPLLSMMQEA